MGDRLSRARENLAAEGWTLLQRAAAALLAFVLAGLVAGHSDPFFAPIAAVISLNTDVGERGVQALRLLWGVLLGIAVGELVLLAVPHQAAALGIAVLISLVIATAAGGSRLVVAQAAASAVLTVSISDGSAGPHRFIDALIGAGVALVFTQVLFSPDPMRLLHRAESQALSAVAGGLEAASEALRADDAGAAETAMGDLRGTRDDLAEVASATDRSRRVARHSLTRRSGIRPLVSMTENASHLDLIGDDAIIAVRLALREDRGLWAQRARALQGLAELIRRLAEDPGDRANRQRVVDDMPEVLSALPGGEREAAPAEHLIRMLAWDVMLYAGLDPAAARRVLHGEGGEAEVSRPADPRTSILRRVGRGTRALTARRSRGARS
ncbi:aromatic acid exporter family protein [Kocuria palustris]|uniref:FUSC family protein n=1 Tax=Kocuria palustris TaxID=71999 RepID=UPI00119E2F2F|nr:FUSC family protein [Kocuria palustris]